MNLSEEASILERGQFCRREFNKRVSAYFKASDIEIGRVADDIMHSLEHLVFIMWDKRETPDCPEFKDAYDMLLTAAGRLKADTLSSHLSIVTDSIRNGDSITESLSDLMDYFNLLLG